ncbi:MAG: VOC family protein [Acidobacteriaceae bacterium]|nr:VOC family protein [Acidobacteriaceae bacterium]MBV8570775.1 VOC family protein [Acidobacteriaceae bacterium]
MPQQVTESARFEGVTPILRVQDLDASIDYYLNVLGFKLDWRHRDVMASVSRDRCSLMLCHEGQGHPGTWVWMGVTDIEPLFRELSRNGAKVRHPPTNYEWAYEMQIEDPDGHVLRMGSDSKASEPVGEWLDERGERWMPSGDGGGWVRVESARENGG